MIAAVGKNLELGAKNKLLWHIPEDIKFFQSKTLYHSIVMGRKTFESFTRPLKNRTSIIVTREKKYQAPDGVYVFDSINKALKFGEKEELRLRKKLADGLDPEVYVIGGAQIFEAAMPYTDRLYITFVHSEFSEAEVFFPKYPEFKKVVLETKSSDANYSYTFTVLERK